ncbi:hypothetical protein ACWGQL_12820 [Streptomyces lydicus]|uniref:hypothetical protein n=2 Tax=Streptomyces lydicus TaxID=47763 RepID=UPI00370107E7
MTATGMGRSILNGAIDMFGRAGTAGVVVFLLLYVGVVLPAVWSTRPCRRTAARHVLTVLVSALHAMLGGPRSR